MTELNFCPDCGDVLDGSCECPPCEFDEDTRTVEQAWVDGIYRQSIDLLGQLQSLERVLLADLDDFTLDPDRASQAAKRMRKVVQDIRSMVMYTRLVNRS